MEVLDNREVGIVAAGHDAVLATMLYMGYTPREAAIVLPEFGNITKLVGGTCIGHIFTNVIEYCYKVRIGAILGSLITGGETLTFAELYELSGGKKLYIFNPINMTYFNTDDNPEMEVRDALTFSLIGDNRENDSTLPIFRTMTNTMADNITTVEAFDNRSKFSMPQVLGLCKFFTNTEAPLPRFAENILYNSSNIYIDTTGCRSTTALVAAGRDAVVAKNTVIPPPPSSVCSEASSDDGFYLPAQVSDSDEFVIIN